MTDETITNAQDNALTLTKKEERIVALHGDKVSWKRLKDEYGFSQNEIQMALRKAGVTKSGERRSRATLTQEEKDEICQQRSEGADWLDLQLQHGISQGTLRKVLKAGGLIVSKGTPKTE